VDGGLSLPPGHRCRRAFVARAACADYRVRRKGLWRHRFQQAKTALRSAANQHGGQPGSNGAALSGTVTNARGGHTADQHRHRTFDNDIGRNNTVAGEPGGGPAANQNYRRSGCHYRPAHMRDRRPPGVTIEQSCMSVLAEAGIPITWLRLSRDQPGTSEHPCHWKAKRPRQG
jgi:hypothetical protein